MASAEAAVRPYPLDNAKSKSSEHHAGLAGLLDPFTKARITHLVDLAGKRCLEVGAGGGSIAVWLAEQVGPAGSVVATDLKPQHIPPHERLTVLAHDLTAEPIPGGPYDVIHCRLVLHHLPSRRDILRRLVQALAPGGVLINEDWASDHPEEVLATAPTADAAELYTLYLRIAGEKGFAAAGTDRGWARRVHGVMVEEGLVDVSTLITATSWTGGSVGARMTAAIADQLRDKLIAAGMTVEQLEQLRNLLDDPRLAVFTFPLYSTAGWAPRGEHT